MTKPIIIDGVDVSECDFYCKKPRRLKGDNISDVITWCQARYIPCSDYDNCYYKQLQRLKAENDELKTKIFDEGLRRKTCKYYKQVCSENTQLIAYRNALEEVHNLLSQSMDIKLKSADKHFSLIDEAIEKINEALKDE